MDFQKFYDGKVFDAYKYMGAHPTGNGVIFRVFAPNADGVTLIGEFNEWKEQPMEERERKGFWEAYVDGAHEGQMYKYVIYAGGGRCEHCDPYGFGMELRPNFASIVRDMDAYTFHDEKWMSERTRCFDRPLNIYEMHLGSWKRKDAEEEEDCWLTYEEIAEPLIEYIHEHHYTHVEFMPLAEHPFDGSWGYQQTGFFAPTSRYGTADQLKALVDALHEAGIGVIMDFVPAHFANDYYALKRFDGTELYEYPASDVSDSEWGSCNFIFSRREVACFMQSSANYWLQEYHFDGLRMDAISRIIYWMGDEARGVNTTAVDFLRRMNGGLHRLHPTAMLIAEDSTSFQGCTNDAENGGLGFDYKWDLGWMNDTLDYFMKTSDERSERPGLLTFSMMYYYNEKHLLPLSHDEVVHGKRTIIDKIFGSYEEKFPQARCLYLYMYLHPGKKLNFMGNEIAMFREWDETREPDYFLLDYPTHDSFHTFIIELNKIYQECPALYAADYQPEGFAWETMNEHGHNVYGIVRRGGGDEIRAWFNFSDRQQKHVWTPDETGDYQVLLDTGWNRFGGPTYEDHVILHFEKGKAYDLSFGPFTGCLFRRVDPKTVKKAEKADEKAEKKSTKSAKKAAKA